MGYKRAAMVGNPLITAVPALLVRLSGRRGPSHRLVGTRRRFKSKP